MSYELDLTLIIVPASCGSSQTCSLLYLKKVRYNICIYLYIRICIYISVLVYPFFRSTCINHRHRRGLQYKISSFFSTILSLRSFIRRSSKFPQDQRNKSIENSNDRKFRFRFFFLISEGLQGILSGKL